MANLRLEQHAGTRVGHVDVPSYISGYVDGESCFTVSIPHFETYPLLSGKQHDFLAFADICRRMSAKQHCNPDGLYQIVQLAAGMNPSGKRGYEPASILRSLIRG